jgi:hypothetical protein
MEQPQPKPGWKTSEGWITFAVLVFLGYVALDLARPTSQIIAALAGIVLKAGWFVAKRTSLKMPEGAP